MLLFCYCTNTFMEQAGEDDSDDEEEEEEDDSEDENDAIFGKTPQKLPNKSALTINTTAATVGTFGDKMQV
jgi:hypothetical protein